MRFSLILPAVAVLLQCLTCLPATAVSYPDTAVGYYDAYYKSTPDPDPADAEVIAGDANWHAASNALATALKSRLSNAPWLHLFYGVDRGTVHARTMHESSFGEKTETEGDFDFVLKAIVSGDTGAYKLHALLIEGRSRAVIGDCSVPFSDRSGAAAAGTTAAASLPIDDLITRYWREQKAVSTNVAISPIITIRAPAAIPANTSVIVSVKAVDCDGEPLKGAVLSLYCIGGQLSSDGVTLSAAGAATVRFHGGMVDALGSVTGTLKYKTPAGLNDSITASAPVRIGTPEDARWEMRLRLRQSDVGVGDATANHDDGVVREATLDLVQRTADLVMWYREQPTFERQPGVVRTGDVIAMVCNGTFRRQSRQSATKTSPQGMSGSIDVVDETGALDPSNCREIYVTIRGNSLAVVGSDVPCETWDDTFNQSFDSWEDTLAGAVDTETPGKDVHFDVSCAKTLTHADLHGVPLHFHTVSSHDVDGVQYTTTRDIDGELIPL